MSSLFLSPNFYPAFFQIAYSYWLSIYDYESQVHNYQTGYITMLLLKIFLAYFPLKVYEYRKSHCYVDYKFNAIWYIQGKCFSSVKPTSLPNFCDTVVLKHQPTILLQFLFYWPEVSFHIFFFIGDSQDNVFINYQESLLH